MWNSLSIAISMAVMSAVRELLRLLSQQPTDQNITNQELAQHYQRVRRAEAQARESRRREEEARMREREAIQREQDEAKVREEGMRREKEAVSKAQEQEQEQQAKNDLERALSKGI